MSKADVERLNRRSPRLHYGYVILLFAMLNLAGSLGFGRFAYTMILPAMRDGLGLQNTQMGIIGTIGFIGYMAMCIPGGLLATRFGPRIVIALGLLTCGAGMMSIGTISGLTGSIVLMIVVGIASAAGNAAGFAFASAWFVGRIRGAATGITLGGPGIGMAVVGLLVPFILSRYGDNGWRWAWYYCGAITVLLGILCWIFLRNHPAEMGLQPIGAPAPAPTSPASGSESVWTKVFKSREMWRLCAITLAFGFDYIIYGTFFASFVQDEVGLSKGEAGNLWSLVGFLTIFSGLLGGLLADRVGRSWAFTCLFLAQGMALLLVAMSHSIGALYLSMALYGLSAWGFPALLGATCGDLLGPRLAPAGVGFAIFTFAIGQAAGPITAGALYDRSGSFRAPFLVGAGVVAFGILATWIRFTWPRRSPGTLSETA